VSPATSARAASCATRPSDERISAAPQLRVSFVCGLPRAWTDGGAAGRTAAIAIAGLAAVLYRLYKQPPDSLRQLANLVNHAMVTARALALMSKLKIAITFYVSGSSGGYSGGRKDL
jgi:hypothetical protein